MHNNSNTSLFLSFLEGGIIGTIVFILLYGFHVLDVTNIDWILQQPHSDILQHYMGWAFFRNGEWMFPWGMTNSLSYPMKSSIIFTDSIPHWAFFFKLISPILPQTFQYFGIFGLFCMFMQGATSSLLVKRLTNNTIYALLASIFFLLATPLSKRLFIHTALASQWIIIVGLYLFLFNTNNSFRQRILYWTLIIWYAAGIHITILAICCIILGFDVLKSLNKNNIWPSFVLLGIPVIVAVATIYLYGGLTSDTNPVSSTNDGGGLGWCGANLNMPFNPIYASNSTFLSPLPISNRSNDGGYCYLGLGGIMLLIASIVYVFLNRKQLLNETNKKNALWTIIMIIVFSIIAISPRVTCGSKVLFEYHPPKLILGLWEVFRATGRFMWPIYYLILILTIITFHKYFTNHTIATILFSIILFIQTIDIVPGIYQTTSMVVKPQQEIKVLSSEWEEIAHGRNLVCSDNLTILDYPEILQWANEHHMKLNTFYFAHSYEEYHTSVENTFKQNALVPNPETVYLFLDQQQGFLDSCRVNLNIINLDGILVGINK